jgi:hypothetical protein
MYNSQTDSLGLIECVVVEEGGRLFGKVPVPPFDRSLQPLPGKHQEVFRGGVPIGSVFPPGAPTTNGCRVEPVKVRSGDRIYRVSVSPKTYPIVGTILTKDRYQRIYEMSIEWQISNPLQIVYMYQRGEDPTGKAIAHFKASFQRYASCFDHNKLDAVQFPFNQWAKSLRDQYGVIAFCSQPVFRFDNKKTQEDKVHQDAKLRKFVIEAESDVKILEEESKRDQERQQRQFERDEKSKQNDFLREEKLKAQLNEARIKLLVQSVNDLVLINRERLKDAVDCNGSFKAVLEDSLKLLNAFNQPPQEEGVVVDASLQEDALFHLGNEDEDADSISFNFSAGPHSL